MTIKHQEDGSKTTLLFNEFTLVLHGFIIYDEENNTKNVQKDSVTIFAELGETIEAKQLSIFSEFLQNIKIEQRFETSVTIMNEGPHCDLIDWIHFYSNWKFLKTNNNNQFICAKYSSKEKEKFPQIPIEELKLKVLEQCGEDWAKIIQYIKNPNEYPSGVNISRYFLRISGDRKDSGEKISKLIIIDVPMGC
ncbi:MAG: hypothetical protein HYU67_13030 [Flavobacteriia bacterium]|nr:hypothetical protein [Flavobacteriia bacterium]